jgi:putative addiction module component (TIGR02574 family)
MNQTVEQLFQAALKLTDAEQLQLVSALTAAVEERGLKPFDDSWLEEIGRRSAEYDAGLVQSIPWTEVKERARQRAHGNGKRDFFADGWWSPPRRRRFRTLPGRLSTDPR